VQTIFLKKQALAAQTQNLTPHFGKLSPYQLLIVLFKVSEKKWCHEDCFNHGGKGEFVSDLCMKAPSYSIMFVILPALWGKMTKIQFFVYIHF
jgi:hypothetical protein